MNGMKHCKLMMFAKDFLTISAQSYQYIFIHVIDIHVCIQKVYAH